MLSSLSLFAQQAGQPQPGTPASKDNGACETASTPEAKRLFGIVPNFRTSPCLQKYKPLSTREKFKIARQDSFDRGTVVLAAAFAGVGQLTNANPTFGQGVAGYASYFGTAYADFVIGDFMTEAIYPSLLHQDPRYFRRGHGSGWSRFGYAAGQIFWTHNDSGTSGFNFSEVLGNASGAAISMSYYPDNRDAKDMGAKLGTQLGVDAASNVLKEFWPEIERGLHLTPKQHN
ncbi:MAG TPA: hypothetical protein VH351_21345 [Bryobacteraceae bacterium]|nr:hypothetical protein [Bryobacteraceae bacterium]